MWKELGYFALGVLKGVADLSSSGKNGQNFMDMARHLSNATGFEISDLCSNQVTFHVPYGRQMYLLVVTFDGEDFLLRALSLIEFPAGRVPADVCDALARHNGQMSRCGYDLFNGAQGSFFFVKTKIRLGSLVPLFADAASDLVGKIATLDQALIQCGHAR